ncbi:hypothetical protein CEXT_320491 [Caerostris extrusa]|uniref:Uncharacterized protein n=1 Tax=Caerostris extrusa TaxID=172846 RepID=A0AAV4R165_CAEEX|nr:hypothetical protein CEXT_320491 [Caerostris extrusa]
MYIDDRRRSRFVICKENEVTHALQKEGRGDGTQWDLNGNAAEQNERNFFRNSKFGHSLKSAEKGIFYEQRKRTRCHSLPDLFLPPISSQVFIKPIPFLSVLKDNSSAGVLLINSVTIEKLFDLPPMLLSISPGIKYNRGSEVKLCRLFFHYSRALETPFLLSGVGTEFQGLSFFPPVFNFRMR